MFFFDQKRIIFDNFYTFFELFSVSFCGILIFNNNMYIKDWINEKKHLLSIQELNYLVNVVFEVDYIENFELNEIHQKKLNIVLQKRLKGLSLAKIIGKKAFYEDYFLTNEYTLDPRPETEFLIEKIKCNPKKILELGVGTGCLILSILKKWPKSRGIGVDISHEALKVANENAEILNLSKKVEFKYSNWANEISGHFDLIVSNPPYVDISKKSELSKEALSDPELALFGDISTYIDLMNSLKNITFTQFLLEIPEYLLKDFEQKYSKTYEFNPYNIYNSGIFCVELLIKD